MGISERLFLKPSFKISNPIERGVVEYKLMGI